MRGDRPWAATDAGGLITFTPHARGSTVRKTRYYSTYEVYPACAGIDLPLDVLYTTKKSLPRMRGDRPGEMTIMWIMCGFTPHARGSTLTVFRCFYPYKVYPACAGIDR